MRAYRQYSVWQKAHKLTLSVYRVTAEFPREESYGLIAQLRRASASIAANIAEGCGRGTDAELRRFCSIAAGSANETECHLLLSKDLGMLPDGEHDQLCREVVEIRRMLAGLMQKLKADG